MKKYYILFSLAAAFLFSVKPTKAQDCTYYYPQKAGAEMEMKSYNEKNKLTSIAKSKILDVSGGTIKVQSEVFDEKEKPVGKSEFTFSCKNGEFVVDLSGYLKGVDMNAYKDMDVKIETEDLHLPASLKAGDMLDDGMLTMKVSNNAFTIMTITVKVYNRKVVGIENITTPAGTFECAKITYNIDSKIGFNVSAKGVEWVSKNVGVVKSESYNSKDKLMGYTLLTTIKQ